MIKRQIFHSKNFTGGGFTGNKNKLLQQYHHWQNLAKSNVFILTRA